MKEFYGVGLILTCFVLLPVRSAIGGCKDIYPDSQVVAAMSKADYMTCKLEVMKVDYADILLEQTRLLDVMRPVYRRFLEEDPAGDDQQRQIRLSEYSAKMQKLHGIATSLQVAVIVSETGGDGATETGSPSGVATLSVLIKTGRKHSQTLESKISPIKDNLLDSEQVDFCKLDFFFRKHDSLHKKMVDCINAGG